MFRIKHHEFWNSHLFHLPVYFYWLYLSLKARSLFFFSAANPGIENGGLLGESKYRILRRIDPRFVPATRYYEAGISKEILLADAAEARITYPFIVKPDIGQGGWMVELIRNQVELEKYLSLIKMPFIVQAYVDEPMELGILYFRYPDSTKGTISSCCVKKLLAVTGNGVETVRQLVQRIPRAKKQLARLEQRADIDLGRIPDPGEVVRLSFAGNHSFGTTFINANHLVDNTLTEIFDNLCRSIDGFYFGRFDIRCRSMDALKAGNFMILELNGVGSEPLHIFDPSEKLISAYASAFFHWRKIFQISMMNTKGKRSFMNFREAMETYRSFCRLQRLHDTGITIGN